VFVCEVTHHRQQDGDGRGVVDDAGERADEPDGRAELPVFALAGVRGDRLLQALDGAGPTDALAQDHHREDGNRRGVREAGDALAGGDARPRPENHERHHDADGGDVDRNGFGDEQHERDENDREDERDADRLYGHPFS
jgi:hypothetical protein